MEPPWEAKWPKPAPWLGLAGWLALTCSTSATAAFVSTGGVCSSGQTRMEPAGLGLRGDLGVELRALQPQGLAYAYDLEWILPYPPFPGRRVL